MSKFDDIYNNLLSGDLELNLDKIFKLPLDRSEMIIKLFNELVDSINRDYVRSCILYNTLVNNEYLVTKREKNLNLILEK